MNKGLELIEREARRLSQPEAAPPFIQSKLLSRKLLATGLTDKVVQKNVSVMMITMLRTEQCMRDGS